MISRIGQAPGPPPFYRPQAGATGSGATPRPSDRSGIAWHDGYAVHGWSGVHMTFSMQVSKPLGTMGTVTASQPLSKQPLSGFDTQVVFLNIRVCAEFL